MTFLLNDGIQSDFITTFFPILRIVLFALIFICAIVLIIAVLLQSDDSTGGTNVISGTRESYYSENKGDTKDGRLKKITIISAAIIIGSIVLYLVSLLINKTAI
ncbi:MAG: preprotein translocase subunit SecG [Christensenellales bacterium]|jgi:preprotein translocase subunit SecG